MPNSTSSLQYGESQHLNERVSVNMNTSFCNQSLLLAYVMTHSDDGAYKLVNESEHKFLFSFYFRRN